MNIKEILDRAEDMPTDAEAIRKLMDDIRQAYKQLREEAGDNPTDEQVAQAEALADALDRAEAALADAREDESAAVEGKTGFSDELEAKFAEKDEAESEEQSAQFADESGEDEAGESEESDDQEEPDDDEKEKFSEESKDMSQKYAGRVKSTGREQAAATPSPFTLDPTAPNYKAGEATFADMAEAFRGVASGRAIRATGDGQRTSAQFARVQRQFRNGLDAMDDQTLTAAVENAVDESKLHGGSLVAAGGWCAPSETLYDFLPTTGAENLFSLPEVSVTRGGLRFPKEPDFSNLFDATKFHMTEAEAISGKTKECVEIPCGDMEELRLDVMWTCVTSNLLQNRAWPELTSKFIAEALKSHMHRLSFARLASVVELSEKVNSTVPALGTAGTVLNSIELYAEGLRRRHRLGNVTIEGVAPTWLRTVMRGDLAFRDRVLPEDVSDAQLDAWLANRKVNLQFVDDYQTDVIGGEISSLAYPDVAKVILYPSGTFVSAVEPVINLGAIYDSTGLSKNQRTELFIEDGYGVAQRAYESVELTIPVSVDGHTGLRAAVGAES